MDRSVDRIVVDLKDCQRTLPRLTNSRKLPTLNMKVLLVADFNDDGIEEVLVLITESNKQRLAFFNLRDNEDFAKTPMFHNNNSSSSISEQQQIGTISIDENGSAQISSHHNNQQQKTETINDTDASGPNTTTDVQPPFVLPSSSLIVAPTYGVDGMIQTPKIHVPMSKNNSNSNNQNSITINSHNTPNTSVHQQHQSVPSTNAGRALFSSSLATGHNINQSQQQTQQETASRSHNNTAPIFSLPRNNGTKMTEIRLSNLPLFDEEDMIIVNNNNKNDSAEGGAGVGSASVVMNTENKKKHPFTRKTNNYTIVDVHLVHYSESTCSAGGFAAKSATAAAATNMMNTQNNQSGNPMMTSSVSSPLIDEFYHHNHHHHQHQHQQPTTPHPQASSFSPNTNTAGATNQTSSGATAATSRRIGGGLVIVLLEGLVIHIPARALNPSYIQQNCSSNMQRANIQLDKVEEHLNEDDDVDGVGVEEQYVDDMTTTSDPTKTTINRIIHVPSNQLEAIWQIPWNCCSSSMETSHAIPHTIFCGFPCGLILSMPIGQHLKTILALQEQQQQQQQQQGAEHNITMNSVLSNGTLPVSASGANISSQYYHQHHSHSNQNPSLSSSSVTPTHHQHHQHAASTTSLSGMLMSSNTNKQSLNQQQSQPQHSASTANATPVSPAMSSHTAHQQYQNNNNNPNIVSTVSGSGGGGGPTDDNNLDNIPSNNNSQPIAVPNTTTTGAEGAEPAAKTAANENEKEPKRERSTSKPRETVVHATVANEEPPPQIIPASTYASALTVGDAPAKIVPIFYGNDKQAVIIATKTNVVLVDKNCFQKASFSQHLTDVQILWGLQVSCTSLETFQTTPTSTSWSIVTDQGNVFLFSIDENGTVSRCEFMIGMNMVSLAAHHHHHNPHHHNLFHNHQKQSSTSFSLPRYAKIAMDRNEELCVIVIHENGSVTICDKGRKYIHASLNTGNGNTIRVQSAHQILGLVGNNNMFSSSAAGTPKNQQLQLSRYPLSVSSMVDLGQQQHHQHQGIPIGRHHTSSTTATATVSGGGSGLHHQPSQMIPFRSIAPTGLPKLNAIANNNISIPGTQHQHRQELNVNATGARGFYSSTISTKSATSSHNKNLMSIELLIVDNCYIRHVVMDLPVQVYSCKNTIASSWRRIVGSSIVGTQNASSITSSQQHQCLVNSIPLASFANAVASVDRSLLEQIRQEKRLTQQQEAILAEKKNRKR